MSQQTLSQTFLQYFKVRYANTDDLQMRAYQIRYQVYCEEFGFFDPGKFLDECETDEMDSCGEQALLIHIPTGEGIGCTRLIGSRGLPISGNFPFEDPCAGKLDQEKFDMHVIPRNAIGEFSRLAVLPQFRRRKNDEPRPVSMPDEARDTSERRSSYPLISLGLFVCSLSMLVLSSLDYGVAMMEPRLARKLRWHGIRFTQIGPVIDFRGKRAPYYISRTTILEDLPPEIEQLRNELTQQLLESRKGVALQEV